MCAHAHAHPHTQSYSPHRACSNTTNPDLQGKATSGKAPYTVAIIYKSTAHITQLAWHEFKAANGPFQMLLVFSHFSVSRPLFTNLPSFPLGQTTFSTPSVPVDLGSFLGSGPSHHLPPLTAAGPPSATCRDPPSQRFDPGAPQGHLGWVFPHDSWNWVSYSISLNPVCHLVWQNVGFFPLSQAKVSRENSPTFFF